MYLNLTGVAFANFRTLQEFLPTLEAFFSEEELPSRADKLFLAKKSGMTYRQIHVWVGLMIIEFAIGDLKYCKVSKPSITDEEIANKWAAFSRG